MMGIGDVGQIDTTPGVCVCHAILIMIMKKFPGFYETDWLWLR